MYTNKTILITKEICQIIGIQDDLQNMGFQQLTVENERRRRIAKSRFDATVWDNNAVPSEGSGCRYDYTKAERNS